MNKLAYQLVKSMPRLTSRRHNAIALENIRANLPYVRHTILDLQKKLQINRKSSAIVVSAGPSLHRAKSIARILKSGYQGEIVAADGALGHCLRNGLVPNYVVTLDPHPTRVVRWFGDPDLESRVNEDDYFRRQDLDPYLGLYELDRNRELIRLVNEHGPNIRALISTSAPPNVTQRCRESGMELYWWNPLFDDFDQPKSLTRKVYRMNKVPCMVSGGNVGTAAWILTHQIFEKKQIVLVGMDFSYAPDTPFQNTQYYKELKEIFGEKAGDALISVRNPYLKQTWYTDPAYFWYRQSFLSMVKQARCKTYNCTEGGILFGKGIDFISLDDFLVSVGSKRGTGKNG